MKLFKNKTIRVEGNIGSGKTTLLEFLEQNENFEVIKEPVDQWLKFVGDDNKNLLQCFYEDTSRYAYLFQTIVFPTRIKSISHQQDKPIRFCERSIDTDRHVFGRACIKDKKMNSLEAECYKYWFDWHDTNFNKKPDGIIYLRCSPEKCQERMKKRSRNEESGVPLEYLQELHNYHEEWIDNIDNVPVLVIDNTYDDNWDEVMSKVNNFLVSLEDTITINKDQFIVNSL